MSKYDTCWLIFLITLDGRAKNFESNARERVPRVISELRFHAAPGPVFLERSNFFYSLINVSMLSSNLNPLGLSYRCFFY